MGEISKTTGEETIAFDRDNLRQLVGFLQEEFPDLTKREIERLCGMTWRRLNTLLNVAGVKNIRVDESEALGQLRERIKIGDIQYTADQRLSTSNPQPGRIPFDRDNLRQIVGFIQEELPGLTKSDIERLCGMPQKRLNSLLNVAGVRTIQAAEAEAIWQLLDRIYSGEIQYKADKGPRVHKPKPGRIVFDRDNLRQLVDFLQEEFPGITIDEIRKLCGMPEWRLYRLLNGLNLKTMSEAEVTALGQLHDQIKSGKLKYKTNPLQSVRGLRKVPEGRLALDQENLRQLVDFLQAEAPGLSKIEIEKMCDMSRGRLGHLLINPDLRTMSEAEVAALGQLLEKIVCGEFQTGKIEFDRDNLRQFIAFLQKKSSRLPKAKIERICGMSKNRLNSLLNVKGVRNMELTEVEALGELCEDLALAA